MSDLGHISHADSRSRPALLSADERRFFAEHGYLVVRGAVSRERLFALEAQLDAIYDRCAPPPAGEVWEVPGISRAAPLLAGHARDAAIAQRAAEALGCARIQLLQDTALIKPAHIGGAVAWHQDHTYTGYLAPANVLSVRLALTDCTAETGCLEVIDGSHLWGPQGDVRALSESHVADALGARAQEVSEHLVRLELMPGDLTFHHCLTFHRSAANRSARTRKTLITRLFDGACRLLPERLPAGAEVHFPLEEDGRLSEAAFPLVWGG